MALVSKPGITGASTKLSIPKDWDQNWFRSLISNYLQGADVRNATSPSGTIKIGGNIASPYGTIDLNLAANMTFTGNLTFTGLLNASGDPLTAATTRIMTGLVALKTSATTSNTGTPTADAALQLTFNETGWYKFELYLPTFEATSGAGGFFFDLNTGSASIGTLVYNYVSWGTALASAAGITSTTTGSALSTISTSSSAPSWIRAEGTIHITAAGTQGVRWAQNTTLGADPTTLMAGAYFLATKIG